jgi:hypothetical protein
MTTMFRVLSAIGLFAAAVVFPRAGAAVGFVQTQLRAMVITMSDVPFAAGYRLVRQCPCVLGTEPQTGLITGQLVEYAKGQEAFTELIDAYDAGASAQWFIQYFAAKGAGPTHRLSRTVEGRQVLFTYYPYDVPKIADAQTGLAALLQTGKRRYHAYYYFFRVGSYVGQVVAVAPGEATAHARIEQLARLAVSRVRRSS